MSHASVVVALSKAIVEVDGLETALEWQMEPFSENRDDGGWFADGTRWDWYQIGGRYTGNLDGYDPYADPANEPGEIWDEQFVRRFLRPLPSDTILVNVDYHV